MFRYLSIPKTDTAQQKCLRRIIFRDTDSRVTEELIRWMEIKGLSSADVAARLGVQPQTIRNWRSSGVPARKFDHLRQIMSEWDSHGQGRLSGLLIKPSPEELRAWNQAALEAGQLIEDWAIDGLNQLAEEAGPKMLRVAEEPPSYRVKRKGE